MRRISVVGLAELVYVLFVEVDDRSLVELLNVLLGHLRALGDMLELVVFVNGRNVKNLWKESGEVLVSDWLIFLVEHRV